MAALTVAALALSVVTLCLSIYMTYHVWDVRSPGGVDPEDEDCGCGG